MFLVAMLMAAAPLQQPAGPVRQPWVELQAGPVFLHQPGRSGLGRGPLLRADLGYEMSERFAAEVWLSGAMQGAPLAAPGDTAVLGGGLGGRFLLKTFDDRGKFGLYAHGGLGWSALTAGQGKPGPTEFLGAIFSYQPFVQKFQVGLEVGAVAFRSTIGGALLPSLRCTF
jgi:hypothetical protein